MSTVLDYLALSAARCPDQIAVADETNCYTFAELQTRVLTLAGQILTASKPGQFIGVYAHRSADTVVGMLAAAAAGCCYVPLNPGYPRDKLAEILSDAGVRLILGCEVPGEYLAQDLGCRYLSCLAPVQGDWPELPQVREEDPLYLIYTSGSTGKPKGILKTHGAMVNFIEAYVDRFGFTQAEVLGNQTPFCFDASAKDLYLMLKTGARMEILPTKLFSFPVKLIEYLNERCVTMISWVPSALALVSRMRTFRDILPTTLRRVFFVGEVLPKKELDAWRSYLPELQYVNLFGASELAGICCYYEVRPGEETPEVLPIGKPLGNSQVFLLGDHGLVTQPGVEGELLVSSGALAACYLGDEEKTAKTLVDMDLNGRTVHVLRTGDLAMYDDNGDLVYRSRRDHQIKHMGYRIELGEIEAAMNALGYIGECCCVYDDRRDRIVAFCTTSLDKLNLKQLSGDLRDKLADYMLPGRLVVLEEMPHNANGKLDRVALKAQI